MREVAKQCQDVIALRQAVDGLRLLQHQPVIKLDVEVIIQTPDLIAQQRLVISLEAVRFLGMVEQVVIHPAVAPLQTHRNRLQQIHLLLAQMNLQTRQFLLKFQNVRQDKIVVARNVGHVILKGDGS